MFLFLGKRKNPESKFPDLSSELQNQRMARLDREKWGFVKAFQGNGTFFILFNEETAYLHYQ